MQRTNFKLGTGGEIYLFSHRESVYCGFVGWAWAVCHGRRCQLQKADARTCGGRLYRLRQARPMARDGEGLGLPVGMRRSPSEDKRISRAHLLPMSRLLAEECRKRAAEKRREGGTARRPRAQAGVPVSRNDLAGHSARKRRHRDRLRSQARSWSLIKIRRAQRTTALSIVLHLTQRAKLFSHEKNNLKSVTLGRGMSVGGLSHDVCNFWRGSRRIMRLAALSFRSVATRKCLIGDPVQY